MGRTRWQQRGRLKRDMGTGGREWLSLGLVGICDISASLGHRVGSRVCPSVRTHTGSATDTPVLNPQFPRDIHDAL